MTAREYVLGRTTQEYERLCQQARLWEPATVALLDRADLGPGGSCLDVGCGPGETMRLLAERVGPTGSVLGIDSDAGLGHDTLERLHAAGQHQCRFVAVDIETDANPVPLPCGTGFDLVLARFLLVHLADPVAGLHRLWRWTASGGELIVQDYDIRNMGVHPPLELVTECRELLAALIRADFGHRLPSLFAEAGVGEPDGTRVAGHVDRLDHGYADWLITSYQSILPTALRRGLVTEDRAAAWFAGMAAAATTASDHAAMWPLVVGVHKRKPTRPGDRS